MKENEKVKKIKKGPICGHNNNANAELKNPREKRNQMLV
jgi:hypothetical protein